MSADPVCTKKKCKIFIIALSLFFVLFCQGCGKKGDPLSPDLLMPKRVTDLTAWIERGGVTLNWSISVNGSDVSRFRVLKSERDVKNACRSCYNKQAVIAELPLEDGEQQTIRKGNFSYRDTEVVYGHSYIYVLYSCDASKRCSGASNTAEIEYNK